MIEPNFYDDPRRGFFNDLAARWDDEEPSAETMVAGLAGRAELLNLQPGQDLLEVGCGTGKTSAWLAAQVAPGKVTAVDFAAEMIARAQAKDIAAEFACVDVCSESLGEECYDVILCFHCFPHFRDQPAAMRNLAAALRPGGRFIVMHLAGSEHINSFHAGLDGPVCSDHLPQGQQWDGLLDAVGLAERTHIDREDLFFLEAVKSSI